MINKISRATRVSRLLFRADSVLEGWMAARALVIGGDEDATLPATATNSLHISRICKK